MEFTNDVPSLSDMISESLDHELDQRQWHRNLTRISQSQCRLFRIISKIRTTWQITSSLAQN
jgi:hypothetical protein